METAAAAIARRLRAKGYGAGRTLVRERRDPLGLCFVVTIWDTEGRLVRQLVGTLAEVLVQIAALPVA